MLYALYDVLDSEESEYDKQESGCIAAKVTVYGNKSGFTLSVSEQPPVTVLTVQISDALPGSFRAGASGVRRIIWQTVWNSCWKTS